MASAALGVAHPKMALGFDAVLVISPEHGRVFREAGWSKAKVREEILARTVRRGAELVRGAGGIADGLPLGFEELDIPKFGPDGLLIVHAGGGAGLFSAIIGGWINGAAGSQPVTVEVGT